MVILKKHMTLGDLSFDVAIDRVIAAEIFEQFPQCFELFLDVSGSEDYLTLNRDKKLSRLAAFQNRLRDIAEFALPKMLEKAGSDCKAEDIFAYTKANENEYSFDAFYAVFWDLAIECFFTEEGAGKKKAPFEMK